MKVLLIYPPAFSLIRESLPPVVEDSTGVYPPLGLLYVGAYADSIPECEVSLIDCQAEKLDYHELEKRIIEIRPDVVGIQVMTFTLIDAVQTSELIKKVCPETFVVFGGPHPTLYPHETVRLESVDAVIYGEGEYPFKKMLERMVIKKEIENIRGVILKGDLSLNNQLDFIENLDDLKMPAYHLLNLSLYSSPLASSERVMTMMSSRGCPGKCIFCDRPQMGKKFRKRSAESVVSEMMLCVKEYGVTEIKFYDDTFTIDKQRVSKICDLLIKAELKIKWEIRARIDTMTPEIISKLYKAGCIRIHYGVETGSPRLQKKIKKYLDLSRVKEVFKLTHEAGIETLGYFMLGLPSENQQDLKMTFKLIKDLPMDYAHIGIFTPYPGTEIYRQALENGVYENDFWREFAQHPVSEFMPKYWTEIFSEEELLEEIKVAYGLFYNRPIYILKRLLKVRSFRELKVKSALGIKLLREVILS